MIARLWRGWTTPANADPYERLLRSEIFSGIEQKKIPGYRGIDLFRREVDGTVEFVTLMWFDSLDAVRGFAGHDHATAVVPPKAQQLLLRFDRTAAHYSVVERHGA